MHVCNLLLRGRILSKESSNEREIQNLRIFSKLQSAITADCQQLLSNIVSPDKKLSAMADGLTLILNTEFWWMISLKLICFSFRKINLIGKKVEELWKMKDPSIPDEWFPGTKCGLHDCPT